MTRWGRILTRTLLAVTAVSAPLLGAATPAFAADTLQAKLDPNQGPAGTEFAVTVQEHLDGGGGGANQKCAGKVQLRSVRGAILGQAISEAADMPDTCKTTITATTPAVWNLTPGANSFVAVLTHGALAGIVSNKLTFNLTGAGGPKSSAPVQSASPTKSPAPTKTPKATLTTEGGPTAQDSAPDFGALTNGAGPIDTGTGKGTTLTRTSNGSSMLGLGIAGAVLIVLGFAAVLFLLLRRRDDKPPADGQPAYPGGGPHDPTYGGGYDRDYVGGGAYASAGAPTMGAGGGYGGSPSGGYGGAGDGFGGVATGGTGFGGVSGDGLGGSASGGYGGQGPYGGPSPSGGFGAQAPGYGGGQGGNYGASPGGSWQARPSGPPDGTAIGSPLNAPTDPWAQHDNTDVVPRLPNRPEPPTGR